MVVKKKKLPVIKLLFSGSLTKEIAKDSIVFPLHMVNPGQEKIGN